MVVVVPSPKQNDQKLLSTRHIRLFKHKVLIMHLYEFYSATHRTKVDSSINLSRKFRMLEICGLYCLDASTDPLFVNMKFDLETEVPNLASSEALKEKTTEM